MHAELQTVWKHILLLICS